MTKRQNVISLLLALSLTVAQAGGAAQPPSGSPANSAGQTPTLSVNAAPIGRVATVERVALAPRQEAPVFYFPTHVRAVLNRPGEHWRAEYATDQAAAYVGVYPIAGIKAQYPNTDKDTVDATVSERLGALRTIATAGRLPVGELPYFPLLNASQAVRGAVKYVQTADVRGVRYLTIHSQESSVLFPRTAVEYTFQGLTRDGKNLVTMHIPYTLNSLHTAEQIRQDNTGGFVAPFPKSQDGPDAHLFRTKSAEYLNWVAARMDAESAKLSELDRVVRSIRVR